MQSKFNFSPISRSLPLSGGHRQILRCLCAGACLWLLAACSSHHKASQNITTVRTTDGVTVAVDEGTGRGVASTIVATEAPVGSFAAVLTKVCSKRRMLKYTKLDGTKGEVLAADAVDLSKISVGDLVTIKFVHAVVLKPRKLCQPVKSSCCKSKGGDSPPDTCQALPSLRVTQLNKKKGTLRVQGELGTLSLSVRDAERLTAVAPGDVLKVLYAQVYATQVSKR